MNLKQGTVGVWPLNHFRCDAESTEQHVRDTVDAKHWCINGAAEYAVRASGDRQNCLARLQTEHNNFLSMATKVCNITYKPAGKGALSHTAVHPKRLGTAWKQACGEDIPAVANKLVYLLGGHAHIECFRAFTSMPLPAFAERRVMETLGVVYEDAPDNTDTRAHGCVSRLMVKIISDRRYNSFTRSVKSHKTMLSLTDPFDHNGNKKREGKKKDTTLHKRLQRDRGRVLAYNRSLKGEYYYIGFHSLEVGENDRQVDTFTWGQVGIGRGIADRSSATKPLSLCFCPMDKVTSGKQNEDWAKWDTELLRIMSGTYFGDGVPSFVRVGDPSIVTVASSVTGGSSCLRGQREQQAGHHLQMLAGMSGKVQTSSIIDFRGASHIPNVNSARDGSHMVQPEHPSVSQIMHQEFGSGAQNFAPSRVAALDDTDVSLRRGAVYFEFGRVSTAVFPIGVHVGRS